MNPDTVYAKTEKGRERFDARDIPTNLRHALILVDGHSTLQELMKKGEGMAQLADAFEMLAAMGLMAPVGEIEAILPVIKSPADGAPVKRQLVALAMAILGDQAEKIIRKIDETADSNTALTHTIDSCCKIIRLTIDEKKADEFVVAAKALMTKNG